MTLNHTIFTRWPTQSLLGWVRNLIGFCEAREIVGFDRFLHVQAWLDRGLARPAVLFLPNTASELAWRARWGRLMRDDRVPEPAPPRRGLAV